MPVLCPIDLRLNLSIPTLLDTTNIGANKMARRLLGKVKKFPSRR